MPAGQSPAKNETDYLKTLQRMYKDSRILFEKGEYYNCCYLCGYIIECALKYILLRFGRKEDGSLFSIADMKSAAHNTNNLNQQLESWINCTGGVAAKYRMDCSKMCPYIFTGRPGFPHWSPEYRYGEHPKWDDEEYCKQYVKESEKVFRFIAEIVAGGASA